MLQATKKQSKFTTTIIEGSNSQKHTLKGTTANNEGNNPAPPRPTTNRRPTPPPKRRTPLPPTRMRPPLHPPGMLQRQKFRPRPPRRNLWPQITQRIPLRMRIRLRILRIRPLGTTIQRTMLLRHHGRIVRIRQTRHRIGMRLLRRQCGQ